MGPRSEAGQSEDGLRDRVGGRPRWSCGDELERREWALSWGGGWEEEEGESDHDFFTARLLILHTAALRAWLQDPTDKQGI